MIDKLGLQPSEIDRLPLYKFLHYRNKLAEKLKAESEAHRKQQRENTSNRSSKPSMPASSRNRFKRR